MRDELLNGEVVYSLREAQIIIEGWSLSEIAPIKRTPAMRLGIQEAHSDTAKPPRIYQVLYRPWIYANPPL